MASGRAGAAHPAHGGAPPRRAPRGAGSFDRDEIDIEHQRGAGRYDASGAALTVGEFRGNDEPPALSNLHAGHALIPTLDDLAGAHREAKRLALLERAVELLALVVRCGGVIQPAGVVHDRKFAW